MELYTIKFYINSCFLVCTASNITSDSGTLTSPNYPNNYDNNLDCETIITTSADKVNAVNAKQVQNAEERNALLVGCRRVS